MKAQQPNALLPQPNQPHRTVPPPKTYVHAAARWFIKPLVKTSVTPNHITTVRLITAVLAAGAFAMGKPFWNFYGGLIFILSAFIDRADGELARVSGRTSPEGHAYDLLCDALANTLAFIGIGIGLRHGPLGSWTILLGLIAGAAIGGIFWLIAKIETAKKDGTPVFASKAGFDPDDGLFLLGPIAWAGAKALAPLLIAAAIGAPLFAIWTAYRDRRALFANQG